MIKLKDILLESGIDLAKYWWLDPQGKLHKVTSSGHGPFAAHYLSTLIKDNPKINMSRVYDSMYALGWVRVAVFGYMGQNVLRFNLGGSQRINSIQMETLIDVSKDNSVVEIIDDTHGMRYPSSEWE